MSIPDIELEVNLFANGGGTSSAVLPESRSYTTTASATVTLSPYSESYVSYFFWNGILLRPTSDYTVTAIGANTGTFTLVAPAAFASGDTLTHIFFSIS